MKTYCEDTNIPDFEIDELIPRDMVGKYTNGLLNGKTLANLDCQGKGIPERCKKGRKIAYPVAALKAFVMKGLIYERLEPGDGD